MSFFAFQSIIVSGNQTLALLVHLFSFSFFIYQKSAKPTNGFALYQRLRPLIIHHAWVMLEQGLPQRTIVVNSDSFEHLPQPTR